MAENLRDIQNSIFVPFYSVEEATAQHFPNRSVWAQFQGNTGQQLVNCWAEVHKSGVGDNAEVLVQKRPGINLALNPTSGLTTLQTAWDNQFANFNGAPAPAAANFRAIKATLCVTQLQDMIVTAAVHYQAAATPGVAVLKIVMWKPYAETAAVHEIAVYNDSAVGNVNNGFDVKDEVYLNEFGTVAALAGTGAPVVPAVSIVWIRHDKARSAAWTMDWTGAAFAAPAQIVTNQFATHYASRKVLAGNFAMLNGRAHIMTQDGYIWSSEIGAMGNAAASWQDRTAAPMYTNAISYPDLGIGVMRYKHHIVAFGQDSIEFFSDAGKERGSPLSATDQAFIKFGAINASSITNVEDTLYWISAGSKTGVGGMYKLEGYSPTKVSHDQLDYWISQSAQTVLSPGVWRDVALTSIRMFGKTHICISGPYVFTYDNMVASVYWETQNAAGNLYRATNAVGGRPYTLGSGNNMYMYNTNDKTWWIFGHDAMSAVPAIDDAGQTQLAPRIFPVNTMIGSMPTTANPIFAPDRTYVFNSVGNHIYKVNMASWLNARGDPDHLFMDSDTTSQEIWFPVVIKTNVLDFGKNARKSLHKVAIVGRRSYGDIDDVTNQSFFYDSSLVPTFSGSGGSNEDTYKQVLALAKAQVDTFCFNNFIALTWQDTGRMAGSLYSEAASAPHFDGLYNEGDADLAVSPMANRAKMPIRYINNYNPFRQERVAFHRCGIFRERQLCLVVWTAGDWVGKGWEFNVAQLVS